MEYGSSEAAQARCMSQFLFLSLSCGGGMIG